MNGFIEIWKNLYRERGDHLLVFSRKDWHKIQRTIRKCGSKRLNDKLRALNVQCNPVDIHYPHQGAKP